ncbi:hypothetical protein Ddc_11238 [Ditylenchus destructor]|nr:hypothetical protein Ddc_11238 [Ditylenchus destructor]
MHSMTSFTLLSVILTLFSLSVNIEAEKYGSGSDSETVYAGWGTSGFGDSSNGGSSDPANTINIPIFPSFASSSSSYGSGYGSGYSNSNYYGRNYNSGYGSSYYPNYYGSSYYPNYYGNYYGNRGYSSYYPNYNYAAGATLSAFSTAAALSAIPLLGPAFVLPVVGIYALKGAYEGAIVGSTVAAVEYEVEQGIKGLSGQEPSTGACAAAAVVGGVAGGAAEHFGLPKMLANQPGGFPLSGFGPLSNLPPASSLFGPFP